MLLEAGQVIDDKYRLVRLIGTGGMGAVYEGENVLIRRRVAIKVLNADSAGNEDVIRRFVREAQAAGEIGNDHILEVLDLGALPSGDRYMVMEYLDGETLAARIERHGRLTPAQIAPLARQFLTALASAHAAGIIHRDLKPENIFILRTKAGRTDFVKLIDFGISKFSRPFKDGEHRMTRADAIFGTPCYMSPEQARGAAEVDVRSDIYSCGVILYEAVTGKLPFDGDSFNDLMFKIALSDAPSPLTIIPSLDPEFAWIINRAIARNPDDRFPSVQQFAEKLDEWMRKNALTETLAQPPPPDAFPPRLRTPMASKSAATLSRSEPIESITMQKAATAESWAHSKADAPSRNGRGTKVAAATVGAAIVVIGIVLAMRSGASGTHDPVSTGAPFASASSATTMASAPQAQTASSTDSIAAGPPQVAPATSAPVLKRDAPSKPVRSVRPRASAAGKPRPGAGGPAREFDLGY